MARCDAYLKVLFYEGQKEKSFINIMKEHENDAPFEAIFINYCEPTLFETLGENDIMMLFSEMSFVKLWETPHKSKIIKLTELNNKQVRVFLDVDENAVKRRCTSLCNDGRFVYAQDLHRDGGIWTAIRDCLNQCNSFTEDESSDNYSVDNMKDEMHRNYLSSCHSREVKQTTSNSSEENVFNTDSYGDNSLPYYEGIPTCRTSFTGREMCSRTRLTSHDLKDIVVNNAV